MGDLSALLLQNGALREVARAQVRHE
jgi:hypothetical protein